MCLVSKTRQCKTRQCKLLGSRAVIVSVICLYDNFRCKASASRLSLPYDQVVFTPGLHATLDWAQKRALGPSGSKIDIEHSTSEVLVGWYATNSDIPFTKILLTTAHSFCCELQAYVILLFSYKLFLLWTPDIWPPSQYFLKLSQLDVRVITWVCWKYWSNGLSHMDSMCIAEVCLYQSISFISEKKLNKSCIVQVIGQHGLANNSSGSADWSASEI